jgi:hypothetical protein
VCELDDGIFTVARSYCGVMCFSLSSIVCSCTYVTNQPTKYLSQFMTFHQFIHSTPPSSPPSTARCSSVPRHAVQCSSHNPNQTQFRSRSQPHPPSSNFFFFVFFYLRLPCEMAASSYSIPIFSLLVAARCSASSTQRSAKTRWRPNLMYDAALVLEIASWRTCCVGVVYVFFAEAWYLCHV